MESKENILEKEQKAKERISKVLKENQGNMTEKEYAKFLEIGMTALYNYKNGRLPTLNLLINIKEKLNLSYDYLIGEIDVINPSNVEANKTLGLHKENIIKLEKLKKKKNEYSLLGINALIENCTDEFLSIMGKYISMPNTPDSLWRTKQNFTSIEKVSRLAVQEKSEQIARRYLIHEYQKFLKNKKASDSICKTYNEFEVNKLAEEILETVKPVIKTYID